MTTLYAQPDDTSACGFYFDSAEEYETKASALSNDCGQPVEEFEIQVIEGHELDAKLFDALRIHQGNLAAFLESAGTWSQDDKLKVLIGVGEIGLRFNIASDEPQSIDVDLFECESLRDLAEQFVDDGLFGDIPPPLANYIDYDAIARDLGSDYGLVHACGRSYAFRSC